MTGIERAALSAAIVALGLGATAASAATRASPGKTPWFALADLRQAKQSALLYAANSPSPRAALSYVPLAPAEARPRVACCVHARGRARPDTDSGAALLQADTEAPPLQRQAARLSRPVSGPVIALAIDGRHASVDSTEPQTLLIRWQGRAEQLQVRHCASTEGMHVRVTQLGGRAVPVQQFYLPLGMEVEADCPADMLNPPAK
jgi:hypothetical protein